jgi:hypothetical protein
MTLSLSGCANNRQPAEITAVPKINPYKYITWSRKDTPETIRQIMAHNAMHAVMQKKPRRGGQNER